MSLKTKDGYHFDSFDRFGDDLCELLLSYLSISDKIRFECVSKQWKSLIFNRQQSIRINCAEDRKDSIKLSTNITSNKTFFEKLFQKFRFIEEVYISTQRENKIFESIVNVCNNLKTITSSGDVSNAQEMKTFKEKCGQKLKCLFVNTREVSDVKKLFRLTPNLEKIHYLFIPNAISLKTIYFSKLKEISFPPSPPYIPFKRFKTFSSLYLKQIEKIYLCVNSEINNFLAELSLFENLQTLQLYMSPYSNEQFENDFALIGNNCKKLTNLFINFVFKTSELDLKDRNICGFFSGFIVLEKLILKVNRPTASNIKSFENCKKLKHLELDIHRFNKNSFECIDLYLPNLKTMSIHMMGYLQVDSLILQSLAKSRSLLRLVIKDCIINDALINFVIKNCNTIRQIYFNGICESISRNSLDLFENCHKNNYKFDFELNSKPIKNELFHKIFNKRKYYFLIIKNW
jgi:hypothetical protein